MKKSPAILAAILMTSLALAGCSGPKSDTLDMLVTPSEDAVTAPFLFEAIGPEFDNYKWDFGDGVSAEGAEVEHLFGFTNGDVTVTLTGSNEGGEEETVRRSVSLGGARNVNPQGDMVASTYWVDIGERFRIDASGSADPDGDPLLYRWTCERKADLLPVDTSHPPHAGLGGVPFGVDAWGAEDPNLTVEATDYGADLCNELDSSRAQDWSRDNSAIEGSIPADGTYVIEVFVRDPKGSPWVGRINLWVASEDRPKPEPNATYATGGTFQGGAGGSADNVYYNGVDPDADGEDDTPSPSEVTNDDNQTFDYYEFSFVVDIHASKGDIAFSYEPAEAEVRYQIFNGAGTEVVRAQTGDYSFGEKVLRANRDGSPQEHILGVTLQQGTQVTFDWQLDIEHDVTPLHWYELPPP